jgi:hypothetical protein
MVGNARVEEVLNNLFCNTHVHFFVSFPPTLVFLSKKVEWSGIFRFTQYGEDKDMTMDSVKIFTTETGGYFCIILLSNLVLNN